MPDKGALGIFANATQAGTAGDNAELDFERTDSFSFSFWYRPRALGWCGLISKQVNGGTYLGWGVWIRSPGTVSLSLSNSWTSNALEVRTTAALSLDVWHHIGLTYDGSSSAAGITHYVDGSSVAQTTMYDALSSSIIGSEHVVLGGIGSAKGSAMNGMLMDIRVFNAELSAANMTDLYNGTDYTTNLQNHWKIEDAVSSLTVTDSVGTADVTLGDQVYRYNTPTSLHAAGGTPGLFRRSHWEGMSG